ncbi:MAG: helix-turn-helix domain-containing protein [Microlunatus sp.]|nr:helix-turn-helix domain-containing protein [Microlunatus sp.]
MPKSILETLQNFGTGGQPPTPAAVLTRLYGTGPRGGLNTRAAAADLGVSARTVRRWAHQGIPASAGGRQLQTAYQNWETSPSGRAVTLEGVEAGKRDQPMAITFRGKVIISDDPRNNTNRSLSFALSPAETNLLLDAGRTGGEPDLHAALEYIAASKGFGGSVSLDIIDLNIR